MQTHTHAAAFWAAYDPSTPSWRTLQRGHRKKRNAWENNNQTPKYFIRTLPTYMYTWIERCIVAASHDIYIYGRRDEWKCVECGGCDLIWAMRAFTQRELEIFHAIANRSHNGHLRTTASTRTCAPHYSTYRTAYSCCCRCCWHSIFFFLFYILMREQKANATRKKWAEMNRIHGEYQCAQSCINGFS